MVKAALDDFLQFDDVEESTSEDEAKVVASGSTEYTFGNVQIRFPFEAYPCQLDMLERIVKTLNSPNDNALLESPTGSGKSMTILCGVLAWLEQQKKLCRIDAENIITEGNSLAVEECKLQKELGYYVQEEGTSTMDDDFIAFPASKRAKIEEKKVDSLVKMNIPKIYISSRTHRQIKQLVKELHRTSYHPKFVVLGSRTQYCIHDRVRKAKDINEACRETAFSPKGGTCSYYNNFAKMAKKQEGKYTPDCDIEDLVKKGKSEKTCPYFLARSAIEGAEVVFAPYNYLVDPVVREGMGIDLKKDIVIVDEAHNIEDVCRESGGFEVTDDSLMAIQGEIINIVKNLTENSIKEDLLAGHQCQGHVVSILINWLKHTTSTRGQVRRDFETSMTIWQEMNIVEELRSIGISYEQVVVWSRELQKIIDASSETKKKEQLEEKEHYLSFGSCQLLKGLYSSLKCILCDGNHYLSSYRMVKYQSTRVDTNGKHIVFTLGFWCLNPEVTFKSLTNSCKSVILTSGTLSPMDTFSSELGTHFEHRLEALHIIDDSQTWVGCVPAGPDGSPFLGNFKTMDSFAYQDDLSRAILNVCKVVPAGVLCFVPSYGFLDKLIRRMQSIGVYDDIAKKKKIFLEPRQGTPKDFEKLMNNYYKAIKNCTTLAPNRPGLTGAMLFAVYRGKISEGLDLKDNNCRAVIPVGIPYPAYKDPKVVLKREFNDRPVQGRRLLSGQQWYESQAFRALNQALGRCIRHRRDWGAIILLEQRFTNPRNVNQLSKWVRSRVQTFSGFDNAMSSLEEFINRNRAGMETVHLISDDDK